MKITIYLCAISTLFISMFSVMVSPVAGQKSLGIFPPDTKPYGLTYSEHIKNFWKWALKIPSNENPIKDTTGAKCSTGQEDTNSSVFYLIGSGGGTVTRTCEVPAGKGLFIPIVQAEVSGKEIPNASPDVLDKNVRQDQDNVDVKSLYLKVGDKEYRGAELDKYRTHTDAFDVIFPDNGIYGVSKGGLTKAVADGRYVITEPLAKGTYMIHFSSRIQPQEGSIFAQDVLYKIIAK
jgi:hypothetical protein